MSEPDKETLLALLKDKAKELKLVQKKLSKVEDKFVETHKQQKGLIRDRETFVAFLKVIFHKPRRSPSEKPVAKSFGYSCFMEAKVLEST